MDNQAVKTFNDVRTAPELVWLGIDFTKVRLVGPAGFSDVNSIIRVQIHSMNDLWVKEPHKYNFPKFTGKTARTRLDLVYQHNMQIPIDGLILVQDTPGRINEGVVQEVVNECKFPQDNLIGMMFVAESLDKNQAAAFVWVTFVDLNNGKVILASKYAGRAGGIGFRNYWANAFFDVFRQMPTILR